MKTYTTKQGDAWDSIAYSQCGDSLAMDKLLLANQQYIDYYTFPAGIVLNIPEVDSGEQPSLAPPPWKRVAG